MHPTKLSWPAAMFCVLATGLYAAPLAPNVPVRGWAILSDSEPDAHAVIAAAPAYKINQLGLTQALVSSLRDLKTEARLALVNRLTDEAHAAGISEVAVADNAPYELDYYPAEFRTGPGRTLDLDRPAFWTWFKSDYRRLLDRVPHADAVVLTFIGSAGEFQKQSSQTLIGGGAKLAALVNAVADVVVGERHLNLYARIFPNDTPQDPFVAELVARILRPEVRLMIKQSPLDYLLTSPNDSNIGAFARPTVVECDAAGEFNGQGSIVNTWVEDLLRRYRDFAARPNVIGYFVRTDRLGPTRVIGRPGEIQLLTLARAAEDRQVTAEQIYAEFIDAHYGAAARADVEAAFKDGYDIVSSALYILGTVVDDHSTLDYEQYTPPYGHLVGGRWLTPPILYVGHGVNREFHCFADVIDHVAPAFVKDPRYVPPEYVPTAERQWIHSGEAMDEEYLRYIVTEKSYGVTKAEDALAHIERAQAALKPEAYRDLYAYFERTLLTARIQRASASAYFGFRVWCRGETYRTDYVRGVVQNGLAEIKEVAPRIRDYPAKPFAGAYVWAKDADRAERYFRLIVQDGWPAVADQGIADPDGGMKFPYVAPSADAK